MCLCYGLFHQWISQERNWIAPQNYNLGLNGNRRPATSSNQISTVVKEKIPQDKNDMETFIQGLAPNVPYEFWMREKTKNAVNISKIKLKCAYFPSVFDLRFNNK
jgi:hypothetical protein